MQESVTYQAIIQKGVQQGLQQGKQEGKQEEARSLVLRQLTRRFGAVDQELQEQIGTLSVAQLEELGEALLDFQTVTDLVVWLDEYCS